MIMKILQKMEIYFDFLKIIFRRLQKLNIIIIIIITGSDYIFFCKLLKKEIKQFFFLSLFVTSFLTLFSSCIITGSSVQPFWWNHSCPTYGRGSQLGSIVFTVSANIERFDFEFSSEFINTVDVLGKYKDSQTKADTSDFTSSFSQHVDSGSKFEVKFSLYLIQVADAPFRSARPFLDDALQQIYH